MKQGRGNSSRGDTKREPIPHAINPGAVSRMGAHQAMVRSEGMRADRGFSAPKPRAEDIHRGGSQGKHK